MRVWHIFKKDVRLLWVSVLLMALVHFGGAALRSWLGPFQEPSQLVLVSFLLSLASLAGMIALCLAVMHQDAVPGVRQDWLTRPIPRGQLIAAKLLFVILCVQGPLLLADMSEGLMSGFAFVPSLEAAAARNLTTLCLFSLPAVMIGAVTRRAAESFLVAIVGLVVYGAVFLFGLVLLLGIKTTLGGTGLSWIVAATWYALAIVGTIVVLSLQFFRRTTAISRGLIGAGGAAIIASAFLPWHSAFALQAHLAKYPAAADAIALEFNAQSGRFQPPPDSAASSATALYIPVRVTGVPSGAIVFMDRASLQIRGNDGRLLYSGRTNLSVDGVGSIEAARLEVRQHRAAAAPIDAYQRIFLPSSVYARIRKIPVRIDIEYSLTLFGPGPTAAIRAIGGRAQLPALGSCATRTDAEGDDVQLSCTNTHRPPGCFRAFLEYVPGGLRNPEVEVCDPNYAPLEANLWPGALDHASGELPFFDRSGLTRYPVDGPKLPAARLVIETYELRDHFTRTLRIANVRLADFAGPPAASASRL